VERRCRLASSRVDVEARVKSTGMRLARPLLSAAMGQMSWRCPGSQPVNDLRSAVRMRSTALQRWFRPQRAGANGACPMVALLTVAWRRRL